MSWRYLLVPLTPLYAAAVAARGAAYRRGILHTVRFGVPVVSVGNLTHGGTGKTPTVIALVRDLIRHGRRPAVLTRGYGRRDTEPVVVVGPDPGVGPERAGDEPLEIALRLPGVPVVVDPDRTRGGREAKRLGADVLVLDDGFQHLAVARDLDLVLVDAGDPWGGGRLPPLGRLRERPEALARADVVLVTKLPPGGEGLTVLARLRREIHELAPGRPVLGAQLVPARVHRPGSGWATPEALAGARVVALAAVGRPEGFAELLVKAGAVVVERCWHPDHHVYTAADLEVAFRVADRAGAVVATTVKDHVKLASLANAERVWVVEASMAPIDGSWDELWPTPGWAP